MRPSILSPLVQPPQSAIQRRCGIDGYDSRAFDVKGFNIDEVDRYGFSRDNFDAEGDNILGFDRYFVSRAGQRQTHI